MPHDHVGHVGSRHPAQLRMMEGFGVHTFRLINAAGKSRFVKFHWKPVLGKHSLVWDEAQKLAGKDPDFHRRDLWEAIERASFPEWELGVQVSRSPTSRSSTSTCSTPPSSGRGARAGDDLRQDGPEPQPGQLLRRDRAGRLSARPTSCPASTSPTTRCCRGACSPILDTQLTPPRRPQLPRDPDQSPRRHGAPAGQQRPGRV
jgi:hypothetical protein